MRADLHSHTYYSDGRLSVDELINRAITNKVDILAITDHDCFDGVDEALKLSKNIKIIYGIEISTVLSGENVHILGYFNEQLTYGPIFELMKSQRNNRKERAYLTVELLKKHFNINLDTKFIEDRISITRGTIADEITKQGYPYSRHEIFSKMLGNGCVAYLPSSKMMTQYAIDLVHQNNGIAVLAHPCLLKNNNVEDIIAMGLDGLEGIYPSKYNDEVFFRRLAKKHNLVITAGSDFHFINDNSHGDVGQCVLENDDLKKFMKVLGYEY